MTDTRCYVAACRPRHLMIPPPMLKNKNKVLAAALDQTNLWLAETIGRPDLQLQLVSINP